MHAELKNIEDEKLHLKSRLENITRKVKRSNKKKEDRCEPLNKVKFLYKNRNSKCNGSELVHRGIIKSTPKTNFESYDNRRQKPNWGYCSGGNNMFKASQKLTKSTILYIYIYFKNYISQLNR